MNRLTVTKINDERHQICSELIQADVTAVEVTVDHVFAGIGNKLHIFNILTKNCIYLCSILQKQRIHGIRFSNTKSQILCFGNREIVICSIVKFSLNIINRYNVGDWIWDVKWCDSEIMILGANNIVTLWDWKTNSQSRVINDEKCLLYCGIIIGDKWNHSIIMGGSMFKFILIWAPSINSDGCSPLLHKLNAHKGAIFSVFYHHELHRISSTSDDRSVRIWDVTFPIQFESVIEAWSKARFSLIVTVYGHMSRVWKSLILNDGRFITAGEDGQLRLWNDNGTPVCCWETHQGASIRSLSVDQSKNIIVTGGKDGALCLWPFVNSQSRKRGDVEEINFFGIEKAQEMPRRVLLSKSGSLLTVTTKGTLLVYDGNSWDRIVHDVRFSNYCLLQISKDRRYVSLASLFGDVMILKESESRTLEIVRNKNICSGKIYSLHWLSNDSFITCCEDGVLEVWTLCEGIEKISDFILPVCKERWLTSAIKTNGYTMVGDRNGSVHLYTQHKNLHPVQSYHRIHGRLGVSCIDFDDSRIFSIGRDGFIQYWRIEAGALYHMAADRLPVKWPVRVTQSKSFGLLIIGFNEVNFEVWNIQDRKKLFAFKCGGGHRPWDFIISQDIQFVYIKDKVLCRVTSSVDDLNIFSLLKGNHTRDIDCLRFLSRNLILSGGEDATLRVSILNECCTFNPKVAIRSHLSSIKAADFIPQNNSFLVVSVGGRAQLKIWRIYVNEDTVIHEELGTHMLKASNKQKKPWRNLNYTLELEPRHMDVQLHQMGEIIFIYCAGSDAFWRKFVFNLKLKTVELIQEVECVGYCILKLIYLTWSNLQLVITLATDGKATFWETQTCSVMHQKNIHQSGINSCDYKLVDNNALMLATGGDDSAVVISFFEMSGCAIIDCGSCSEVIHEAQVSGLKIVNNYLITSGGDQKVLLWKWGKIEESVFLQLQNISRTLIPDIHGLDVFQINELEFRICVYGVGFEILNIKFQ